MHYSRWRIHGNPLVTAYNQPKPTCSIKDCGGVVYGRGWCKKHYERWRMHGSTDDRPKGNYTRHYALDQHYFDVIDTEEKAYWLGFIAGDGCVRERGVLTVALAAADAAHLEYLRIALCTTRPVRHYVAKRGKRKGQRVAALSICSRRMADALMAHGIEPRKSLILQAWDGPEHLMRHYWRGLIDADGTLVAGAVRNRWQVSLVGSKPIVHAFAGWVRGLLPKTVAQPHQKLNIWLFRITGRVGSRVLAEALYGGCTIALERKAERAAAIIASGPPKRLGHPTSPETRLKLSRLARERHARFRRGLARLEPPHG